MSLQNARLDEDGTLVILENVGMALPHVEEQEVQDLLTGVAEASKSKGGRPTKHLVVKIAGIHEGVTVNATEYRLDELRDSIESWTYPYNKPMITDHNEYEVGDIVGRIVTVTETEHSGRGALEFTVHISDPTAVEKVRDGLWQTVSIGVRVKSAVCSICGNDWAKGTWCEHDRGKHYVKDEDQDEGVSTLCTWVLGGLEGKELSFVTVPADKFAVITAIENGKTEPASSEAYVLSSDELIAISESFGVKRSDSGTQEAIGTMLEAVESVTTERKENIVDPDMTSGQDEELEAEEAEVVEDADGTESEDAVEGDTATGDESDDNEAEADGAEAEESEDDSSEEDATDDDAVDGSESEDSEDAEESEDEDAEASAESEDDEASEQSDEEIEDVDDAGESSDSENLEAELHDALVTVYVERALAAGVLSGENDELVTEYASHSLETMRLLVEEQMKYIAFRPEDIEQIRGLAREAEDAALSTDDDEAANADVEKISESNSYMVKVGDDEYIELDADGIAQDELVSLEPSEQ